MTPSQAYEVIIFILNKIMLNKLYVHVGPQVTFIRSGHVSFMCKREIMIYHDVYEFNL